MVWDGAHHVAPVIAPLFSLRAVLAEDTIFALSSGRPPAAISVIRISGPGAHAAGERIAGSLPEPRTAAVRELRDPQTGDVLDEALVLRFDAPATSTGENIVEFQCHGGRAVVDAVSRLWARSMGLRPAEPGEFTRRAFENGRIDLTEAEGLADLIEAETEIAAQGGACSRRGRAEEADRTVAGAPACAVGAGGARDRL